MNLDVITEVKKELDMAIGSRKRRKADIMTSVMAQPRREPVKGPTAADLKRLDEEKKARKQHYELNYLSRPKSNMISVEDIDIYYPEVNRSMQRFTIDQELDYLTELKIGNNGARLLKIIRRISAVNAAMEKRNKAMPTSD